MKKYQMFMFSAFIFLRYAISYEQLQKQRLNFKEEVSLISDTIKTLDSIRTSVGKEFH